MQKHAPKKRPPLIFHGPAAVRGKTINAVLKPTISAGVSSSPLGRRKLNKNLRDARKDAAETWTVRADLKI